MCVHFLNCTLTVIRSQYAIHWAVLADLQVKETAVVNIIEMSFMSRLLFAKEGFLYKVKIIVLMICYPPKGFFSALSQLLN